MDIDTKVLADFCPKLLAHSHTELYRCNMGDIVAMLSGFESLWQAKILKTKDFANVHRNCQAYLEQYLHKTKKYITGSQLATLCTSVAAAKSQNIYEYDNALLVKLE